MPDARNRLARWRLRLLEFDFTVRYKNGARNQIADAMSRLPTYAPIEAEAYLKIHCFNLSGDDAPVPVDRVDVASWTGIDAELCRREASDSHSRLETVENFAGFYERT